MALHSSTPNWRIPWMEEPGRLQSMGSQRVGPNSATSLSFFTFTFHFHALEQEMATHSSILAWKIPGTGEPGGLPSMGSHRVGHDWSDLAAAACWVGLYQLGSIGTYIVLTLGKLECSPSDPPRKSLWVLILQCSQFLVQTNNFSEGNTFLGSPY